MSKSIEQRLKIAASKNFIGNAGGRIKSATPIIDDPSVNVRESRDELLDILATTSTTPNGWSWEDGDRYTVITPGVVYFELSKIPVEESITVFLHMDGDNGVQLLRSADWVFNEDKNVITLSSSLAATLKRNDFLTAIYPYVSDFDNELKRVSLLLSGNEGDPLPSGIDILPNEWGSYDIDDDGVTFGSSNSILVDRSSGGAYISFESDAETIYHQIRGFGWRLRLIQGEFGFDTFISGPSISWDAFGYMNEYRANDDTNYINPPSLDDIIEFEWIFDEGQFTIKYNGVVVHTVEDPINIAGLNNIRPHFALNAEQSYSTSTGPGSPYTVPNGMFQIHDMWLWVDPE